MLASLCWKNTHCGMFLHLDMGVSLTLFVLGGRLSVFTHLVTCYQRLLICFLFLFKALVLNLYPV